MKFSIRDFYSKCDQIRRGLWIWLHLLKKYSMENLISQFDVKTWTEHEILEEVLGE